VAEVRRLVSWIVGGIQCGLGTLASVFAFLVYASPLVREALGITPREVYLYMFLSSVFGILSILNGLLLLREEE